MAAEKSLRFPEARSDECRSEEAVLGHLFCMRPLLGRSIFADGRSNVRGDRQFECEDVPEMWGGEAPCGEAERRRLAGAGPMTRTAFPTGEAGYESAEIAATSLGEIVLRSRFAWAALFLGII
jgi:hypothetical protein